jgi:hypothetical protein
MKRKLFRLERSSWAMILRWVAAVGEPAAGVGRGDGGEGVPGGDAEGLVGARGGAAEGLLDLAEGVLDGVEVRGVGRQVLSPWMSGLRDGTMGRGDTVYSHPQMRA